MGGGRWEEAAVRVQALSASGGLGGGGCSEAAASGELMATPN